MRSPVRIRLAAPYLTAVRRSSPEELFRRLWVGDFCATSQKSLKTIILPILIKYCTHIGTQSTVSFFVPVNDTCRSSPEELFYRLWVGDFCATSQKSLKTIILPILIKYCTHIGTQSTVSFFVPVNDTCRSSPEELFYRLWVGDFCATSQKPLKTIILPILIKYSHHIGTQSTVSFFCARE